ncbi:MAG: hypothetical protein JNK32_08865 [Anaerolineales bacterium]|nr:hypothetical protein [Anaerolineales bacterium]
MKKKLVFVLLSLVLTLSACLPDQAQIDQIVQATFQALTAQAPAAPATAIPTAAGMTGSISGELSFPSSGVPPLLVVAFNTTTGQYYWVQTVQDQTTYQIDDLPVGKYTVFAYALPDGKLVGAYDQYYVCGMHQGCTDVSLIEVDVQAGVVTPNINPGDWYGDSTQWPSMPNDPSIPNLGVGGENAETELGGIAGQLNYPSNFIPSLVVTAFAADGSGDYSYIITNENSSTYQIENLPAGNYYVVAYVSGGGLQAGYTQAVLCGLSAECTDHLLLPVPVKAGQVTNGVNPIDWYAPEGTFPPYPIP